MPWNIWEYSIQKGKIAARVKGYSLVGWRNIKEAKGFAVGWQRQKRGKELRKAGSSVPEGLCRPMNFGMNEMRSHWRIMNTKETQLLLYFRRITFMWEIDYRMQAWKEAGQLGGYSNRPDWRPDQCGSSDSGRFLTAMLTIFPMDWKCPGERRVKSN